MYVMPFNQHLLIETIILYSWFMQCLSNMYQMYVEQEPWGVVQLILFLLCPPIVTSSSPFRVTYPRQSLALIIVHAASRVLYVPLGLVEMRVSRYRWPKNLRLLKKKKKYVERVLMSESIWFCHHIFKENITDYITYKSI